MATPSVPPPVKLICGMLTSRRELLAEAQGELVNLFGPADVASEIMDFDFTHYYDREMGAPLLRQFVSFAELVPPESLAEVKHATNAMEQYFAEAWARVPWFASPSDANHVLSQVLPHTFRDGEERGLPTQRANHGTIAEPGAPHRPINLDPGYVDSPKLVLASMKNYAHRIYLGRGVYAEVTLLHRRGQWTPLEWTFPDYASGRYWPFLDPVRKRLREQLGSEKTE